MNRPNKEDFYINIDDYTNTYIGKYAIDLERYCDELEKQYKFTALLNSKLAKDLFDRNGTIAKLEKALDKTCDVLANVLNACCEPAEDFTDECGVNCKNHWKEWALKDE